MMPNVWIIKASFTDSRKHGRGFLLRKMNKPGFYLKATRWRQLLLQRPCLTFDLSCSVTDFGHTK